MFTQIIIHIKMIAFCACAWRTYSYSWFWILLLPGETRQIAVLRMRISLQSFWYKWVWLGGNAWTQSTVLLVCFVSPNDIFSQDIFRASWILIYHVSLWLVIVLWFKSSPKNLQEEADFWLPNEKFPRHFWRTLGQSDWSNVSFGEILVFLLRSWVTKHMHSAYDEIRKVNTKKKQSGYYY